MPIIISMLRGVNVGGHNLIRMEALRALYASLKLRDAETYVQSGNVVFRAEAGDLVKLGDRIEKAIERSAGFRPTVVLRTAAGKVREISPLLWIVAAGFLVYFARSWIESLIGL